MENIIVNEGCDDNSKLLLISDSFARSMVMYLCQAFHETRYLDPQEGRYNKSYIDYIEKTGGASFKYKDSILFNGSEALKKVSLISDMRLDSDQSI